MEINKEIYLLLLLPMCALEVSYPNCILQGKLFALIFLSLKQLHLVCCKRKTLLLSSTERIKKLSFVLWNKIFFGNFPKCFSVLLNWVTISGCWKNSRQIKIKPYRLLDSDSEQGKTKLAIKTKRSGNINLQLMVFTAFIMI